MQLFNFTYLVAAATAIQLEANISLRNDEEAAATDTAEICQQSLTAFGTCYESNFMMTGQLGYYTQMNCRVYCDYACQVWLGNSKADCDAEADDALAAECA